MRDVKTLSADDARRAIAAVRAAAERKGTSVVVAVADANGELLALLRMDGAAAAEVAPAIAKAYTAARLERTTRALRTAARHPQTGFDLAGFCDPRIVAEAGGVMVEHEGAVVGAVGVSGETPDTDEALAEAGALAIKTAQAGLSIQDA